MKKSLIGIMLVLLVCLAGCAKKEQTNFETIDIFENVSVEITGIAPFAEADFKLINDSQWYGEKDFTLSKESNIQNGDVLVLTCTLSAEDVAKAGFVLECFEKQYIVENVDMYVNSLEELRGEVLSEVIGEEVQTVCEDTENTEDRMLYRLTGNTNYLFQYNKEWVDDISAMQVILCTPMSYENSGVKKNIIYVVLQAVVANSDYSEEGYFFFEYENGILSGDGTLYINHANPQQRYSCSSEYEELYNLLICPLQEDYYIGTMEIEK